MHNRYRLPALKNSIIYLDESNSGVKTGKVFLDHQKRAFYIVAIVFCFPWAMPADRQASPPADCPGWCLTNQRQLKLHQVISSLGSNYFYNSRYLA
jgi:hypothetical protein